MRWVAGAGEFQQPASTGCWPHLRVLCLQLIKCSHHLVQKGSTHHRSCSLVQLLDDHRGSGCAAGPRATGCRPPLGPASSKALRFEVEPGKEDDCRSLALALDCKFLFIGMFDRPFTVNDSECQKEGHTTRTFRYL